MYNYLAKLTNGKQLPLVAHSSTGELVVIERGKDEAGEFFKTVTSQENGWLRINTYYADGSAEETYRK